MPKGPFRVTVRIRPSSLGSLRPKIETRGGQIKETKLYVILYYMEDGDRISKTLLREVVVVVEREKSKACMFDYEEREG